MKILEPKTLQFLSISWAISSIGLVTKPPVPNITPHPFERSPWYSQVLCLPYRILPLDRRFPQTLVILPSTMPLGLFLPDLSATWFLNSISFHKSTLSSVRPFPYSSASSPLPEKADGLSSHFE